MRITITLVTLAAIALGVAHHARAWQYCTTTCHQQYDGSQRCTTSCL